jgi:hypothetical protein
MPSCRRHRPFVRACIAIALLVHGTRRTAMSFESDEHKWFTDAALCVAEGDAKTSVSGTPQVPRDVLAALRTIKPKSEYCSAERLSLGNVTVYADFVSAPRRLLRTDLYGPARLDTEELCTRSGAFVLGATEMIRNPHHFGREGILEYYAWHEHALLLAARAGTLASRDIVAATNVFTDALVFEGYAIHFLQDFFAPGHVDLIEPSLPIAATLAAHDRVNLAGETFHLSDRWPSPPQINPHAAATCLSLAFTKSAVDEFNGEAHNHKISVEGDNRVYNSTMRKVYKPAEAIFITLATALSIQDVVDLFANPQADWSTLTFPPVEGPMTSGGFGIRESSDGICAWLPIGYYKTREAVCAVAAPPAPTPQPTRAEAMPSLTPEQPPTPTPSSAPPGTIDRGEDPTGFSILTMLPRTAIDVTVDRLNEGSRKTVAGELFLDWWTRSPVDYQTLEWSIGYTYIRGNSYDGQGFDARAYYRFKNLYLWTSLGVGWRFLHDSEGSGNAPTVGGRIGFGPEILSVFTGVSVDSSLEKGKIDIDPLSFEFGVQSIIPWQRVGATVEGWFDKVHAGLAHSAKASPRDAPATPSPQ